MSYILREIKRSDIPLINCWRNDPQLIANLGAPFRYINCDVDYNWFDNYMKNRETIVRCCICLETELETPIGLISLTNIDHLNKNAEFHIMIGERKNQGKGIGKIAVLKMLEHAFYNLNLERIYLTVLVSNTNARSLYESHGFQVEGIQRKAIYKEGEYRNLVMMSILKEEFRKNAQ